MKIVNAKSCKGFNISVSMIVGLSPKYTVICGNCNKSFRSRFNLYLFPKVKCSHCGAINRLPLSVDSEGNEIIQNDK